MIIMGRKGISKTKMAKELGVSKQNVAIWLKDIKTFATLDKICKYLGASYTIEVKENIDKSTK